MVTKMSFEYLEDEVTADIAFRARGKTLNELFASAALAVSSTMVDFDTLEEKAHYTFTIESDDLEMLLFKWLGELIAQKDIDGMVFKRFDVNIQKIDDGRYRLTAKAWGEPLDIEKHQFGHDVKAVTLHRFYVKQLPSGEWEAFVILDI